MKRVMTSLIIFFLAISTQSQGLYSAAYGDPKSEPLIFLHGGPGYNAISFEVSTARKLSENGFYVIVYDRRGEGRSMNMTAKFTFSEAFKDLETLYKKYDFKTATLIGHSFGGMLGTLFAEKNPQKVSALILVSAPLSMQETFSTIIRSSKKIYEEKDDNTNLRYIRMLEEMETTSLEYASYCFSHAMQNGFYTPKSPTQDALTIYNKLNSDSLYKSKGSEMTTEAPLGFWENENYTAIDLSQSLNSLEAQEVQLFGLYGMDDGLFSNDQIDRLENIISQQDLKYLKNCSHSVFIDQQGEFISQVKRWID